jgi:hypothetical protein
MWFANGFANEATAVAAVDASEPPIISSASVLADPVVGLQVSLNVLLHGVTSSGLLDDSDIARFRQRCSLTVSPLL